MPLVAPENVALKRIFAQLSVQSTGTESNASSSQKHTSNQEMVSVLSGLLEAVKAQDTSKHSSFPASRRKTVLAVRSFVFPVHINRFLE
jgi:hypothetical protein